MGKVGHDDGNKLVDGGGGGLKITRKSRDAAAGAVKWKENTGWAHRIRHRRWKETKQHPSNSSQAASLAVA